MSKIASLILDLFVVPILFLQALMWAWIPMLGWNFGLVSVFPSIPEVGYWQAFWLMVLQGWILRPYIILDRNKN